LVNFIQFLSIFSRLAMYCDPHRHLLVLGCRQLRNLFPCPKSQRAFNFPAVIETSYSDRDFLFHRHLGTLLQQKSVTRRVFRQFDHIKRIFLVLVWTNRTGLLECDNINQMITLSMITLSGFHCSLKI
jgi:hypothetical protein